MTAAKRPATRAPAVSAGTPTVSIVVCFFDAVDMTVRCIEAIRAHTPGDLYELIVVDDGSSDPAVATLATDPGLTLITSPHNVGFTRAANLGAERAAGDYLVFLNNDTEVGAGWLEALLDAVESGPEVGAVGAKLINPDGTLQEAGGIIWSDATGMNVGRGEDPADPAYNYRREVDYCSGACLLVRRALFHQVGGFDECFAPGFYEDTDLCFTLRARGQVVLYEPGAQVTHIGGATFGTEHRVGISSRHTKAGQELNRWIFLAKWAEELLHHYPPGTARGRRGGRVPNRPRVLVCDNDLYPPDVSSGGLRMAWILRLLHELGCEVTFFPFDRVERQPYADWLRRVGVEVCCDEMDLDALAGQREGLYDLVIMSRPAVAEAERDAVRFHFPQALTVYDAVDLHFLRQERQLALQPPAENSEQLLHELQRARRHELDAIPAAEVVSTVTEDEASVVRSLDPTADVLVLPNIHAPRSDDVPGPESRDDLLFIGSYRHLPNVDAVLWFTDAILPPSSNGNRCTSGPSVPLHHHRSKRSASATVSVPGYMNDITEHFHRARVFVAPLRYGAGMKGKIGMAMSLGVPVVTTSIGAEGMGLIDGTHALVADEPDAFAEAVDRLRRDDDLWQDLSVAARRLAAREWSPDAMKERLAALVQRRKADGSMVPRTLGLSRPRRGD